jgi:hypothetical protein
VRTEPLDRLDLEPRLLAELPRETLQSPLAFFEEPSRTPPVSGPTILQGPLGIFEPHQGGRNCTRKCKNLAAGPKRLDEDNHVGEPSRRQSLHMPAMPLELKGLARKAQLGVNRDKDSVLLSPGRICNESRRRRSRSAYEHMQCDPDATKRSYNLRFLYYLYFRRFRPLADQSSGSQRGC